MAIQLFEVRTLDNKFLLAAPMDILCSVFTLYAGGVKRILEETANGGKCEFHFSGVRPFGQKAVSIRAVHPNQALPFVIEF